MRWPFAFLLAALIALPSLAAGPAEEADAILHKTVDAVLGFLDDKTLAEDARRKNIVEVITPVFDFNLMAKLTLGQKYWPTFSNEQQQEFSDLFVKQLQQTYFDKVDQLAYDAVVYEPPVATRDDRVQVKLNITSKGEKISTLYKMYGKDGAWRIYDVEVNDVSIVSSYRSDYQEQLRNGSPADLIASLRAKVSPDTGK